MDDMNQWLAEFYGTNQNTLSGEELEKAAQASLLQKLADDSTPLDIDDLSDDEVLALADELGLLEEPADISDREKISMIQKVAASADIDIDDLTDAEFEELAAFALDPDNWEEDESVKEAMAKFAEADFLGRVAAHAQADEYRKIAAKVPAFTPSEIAAFLERKALSEAGRGQASLSARAFMPDVSGGKAAEGLLAKLHRRIGDLGESIVGKKRLVESGTKAQKEYLKAQGATGMKGKELKEFKAKLLANPNRAARLKDIGLNRVNLLRNVAGYGTLGAGTLAGGGTLAAILANQ